MNTFLSSVLGVLVLVQPSVGAQQQRRDAVPEKVRGVVGSAIIAGLVTTDSDAQTPVRRAVVTLKSVDYAETFSAITGDDGRFVVGGVPAGRYTMQAAKPAHLTVAYGARRPGRAGTVIIVAEGERIDDISFSLPRGAVLAGRVTLADGQPVPNVQVSAVPIRFATGGGVSAAGAREFRTDDLGEFRIFGLLPDTYVVAALPTFGRGEIERMSEGAVSTTLRDLAQRSGTAAAIRLGHSVQYAPTYFPGTPSVREATLITVGFGQVREDIHFTVAAFRASTIRGRVIGVDGAPMPASSLSLEAVGPALSVAAPPAAVVRTNEHGVFSITGVSPGWYRLRARAGGVTLDGGGTIRSIETKTQTQIAVTEITVSGDDIEGLVLTLQEGHRFTGRIVTDGSSPAPSLRGATVSVRPVTDMGDTLSGLLSSGVATRDATVNTAGEFSVTGLETFDYEIRVALPEPMVKEGWEISEIRYAERELRDAPITFVDGSLVGVEIRLTTRMPELSGRITTADGAPATDYFIVAFPADRTLWHAGSMRVRAMRPESDGTFRSRGLPGGVYRLAALVDVDERELKQPEFLESIYQASIEVELRAGRQTRQDIRIGR